MLKIHIPVGITEGLSPNLRMIQKTLQLSTEEVYRVSQKLKNATEKNSCISNNGST